MDTVRCARCYKNLHKENYDQAPNGDLRRCCRSCLLQRRQRKTNVRRNRSPSLQQEHPQIRSTVPTRDQQPAHQQQQPARQQQQPARQQQQSTHQRQQPVGQQPLGFKTSYLSWSPLQLGRMIVKCKYCRAFHWIEERTTGTAKSANTFTTYCNQGEVQVPYLLQLPEYLQYLFSSSDTEARVFRSHIREYNSALTFTSIKYNVDDRQYRTLSGIQCFQIHGELYHIHGPLQCDNHERARYAQLYFYDPQYATNLRLLQYPQNLQQSVLQHITEELLAVNPFISMYKTAKERLEAVEDREEELRIILNPQLKLVVEKGADRRRENLPTSLEIAIIIPDEYSEAGSRDIKTA